MFSFYFLSHIKVFEKCKEKKENNHCVVASPTPSSNLKNKDENFTPKSESRGKEDPSNKERGIDYLPRLVITLLDHIEIFDFGYRIYCWSYVELRI